METGNDTTVSMEWGLGMKLTSGDLGPALLVVLDLAVLPGQQSLQLLHSAAELRPHREQRRDQVAAQLGREGGGAGVKGRGWCEGEGLE